MNVMAGSWVAALGRSKTPLVAFTVCHTALDSTSSKPVGEYERVVIPAFSALGAWHSAELGGPEDERVIEHAALLQVEDQRRRSARHPSCEWAVVALDVLVRIPVTARETVVVAGPDLHEAHASLEQSPGDETLA